MNGSGVPGTHSAEWSDDPGAHPLFDQSRCFFTSRAWFQAVAAHGLPDGARARFLLIQSERGAGLFPMLTGGPVQSLTTPYSCLWEPLISGDRASVLSAFVRACRARPTVRLDALDQSVAAEIAAAAPAGGMVAARFAHFGNWHETVSGLGWSGYLARRPGATRETIRRRTRRAEALAGQSFRLFTDDASLSDGIDAFETIYARSWKEPEPFPGFNPAQIRAAADQGIARLGVWWIGDAPVAAQFWIIEQGQATVLKLAHDEAFKAHSPGTVLSAWMIRHMIETEGATALDFGRGDDPYKKDWVSERRQREGVLLMNPRHPGGIAALIRHGLGRLRARLVPTG
jgi:hypothetical protein